jgi:hypothetical protein
MKLMLNTPYILYSWLDCRDAEQLRGVSETKME